MKTKITQVLFLLLLAGSSFSQTITYNGLSLQDSLVINNLPEWVKPILEKSEIAKSHKILAENNPYYFESDFTGDKTIDIVFYVENQVDKSRGYMFVNADKGMLYVVGCGNPTDMGVSVKNITSWFIFRKKTITTISKKTQVITTPGVLVRDSKGRQMVIYWMRSKYKTIGGVQ